METISKLLGPEQLAKLIGVNPETYPKKFRKEAVSHVPQTTSWKMIYHFIETTHFGKLSKFGYQKGLANCNWYERNLCMNCLYCEEQEESTVYDLSYIEGVNTFLYTGSTDGLSNVQEGKNVEKAMQDKNKVWRHVFEDVDHMGLLADKRAPTLIYPKLLKNMNVCHQKKFRGLNCRPITRL